MKKISKLIVPFMALSLIWACSPTPNSSNPTPTQSSKPAGLGTPSATKLNDFVWTKYNLKFKLPSDMKESVNKDDMYEAANTAVTFQLFPWKNAKLTEEDVIKEGIKGADNIDKSSFKVSLEDSGTIEIGGLKGYVVSGTAKQSGTDIFLAVIGLIDPDGSDNFVGYITFDKGKASEDNKNLNVAADIVASLSKSK
ncbi:MAG: hypothetical protein U0354_01555 [Candidatus Sericytochromatia bacterium]